MLLLWLVYVLPFIHIVPYLWFDFYKDDPWLLWGLKVNPYMVDENIIMLTAMIGAVGGLGFALGVSLTNSKIVNDQRFELGMKPTRIETLSTPIWIFWVIVGVTLSWLAAPQETVFTSAYTESVSILQDVNFSSAWMFSYVLLIFSLCDAIIDSNPVRRTFKRYFIFGVIVFVVVFLQLLRGDRESLPFVFSIILIYFYWAAPITQKHRVRMPWAILVSGGLGLLVVALMVGVLRSALVNISDFNAVLLLLAEMGESGVIRLENLFYGTWSAVLLTPLSVAGDHINGLLPLKYGETYLDFILSIPPGFIADWIGYTRPINAFAGPAWDMRYGLGGTHASVVPFMNFQIIGVFLIPALWAYIIARYEKKALSRVSVINLSLLGVLAMASPHWLWYGEKSVINAIIIWMVLVFAYRVSLSLPRVFSVQRFSMPT